MKKQIITLTSDWGQKDHYVASVKAKLMSCVGKDIEIFDISHNISKYNIFETAFILKNCIEFFPKNTIHIISVMSEASPKTPHIVVKKDDCFFIGADNGIFSLLFDEEEKKSIEKIYEIDIHQDSNFFSFSTRDVFVKVASIIIEEKSLEKIGHEVSELNSNIKPFAPAVAKNTINGVAIHIDNYGNIVTNISYETFKKTINNRPFIISFSSYSISNISSSYMDVPEGELVAIFNTSNLLEIAQNSGHASNILGIKFNDMIKIIIDE